jgi:hypothetical protein
MPRYAWFLIVAAWPVVAFADDDVENRAAPPTAAGTTRHAVDVRPGLEVFSQYAYRRTEHASDGRSWHHELDVPRIHAALDATAESVRGRLVIEGVRSASEGALIGVAGNSMVLRAREAFAAYTLSIVEGSAGIVPKLTLPEIDGTWMLRAVAVAPEEAHGFHPPADVGATVRATLPQGYGFVALGGYNGEGYQQRELNRGKNGEAAASIHPIPRGALAPVRGVRQLRAGFDRNRPRARRSRHWGAALARQAAAGGRRSDPRLGVGRRRRSSRPSARRVRPCRARVPTCSWALAALTSCETRERAVTRSPPWISRWATGSLGRSRCSWPARGRNHRAAPRAVFRAAATGRRAW